MGIVRVGHIGTIAPVEWRSPREWPGPRNGTAELGRLRSSGTSPAEPDPDVSYATIPAGEAIYAGREVARVGLIGRWLAGGYSCFAAVWASASSSASLPPGLPVIASCGDQVGTRPASAAARLRPATSIGAR